MDNPSTKHLPRHPNLVFMGTPEFAVPALSALIQHRYRITAVVTQPDRPKGRGRRVSPPPVKETAMENGFRVLQPERASDPDFCVVIQEMAPDLLIVVAYGQILKKRLLDIPRWGVLNIHASLLPKYRGAAPIQRVILNNETKTGLTAMRLDEGLDSGPILLQEETAIQANETAGELHDRLSAMSAPFLIKTIEGLVENRIEERAQDESQATYAAKIDPEKSLVQWDQHAEHLWLLIRALDPWPGAFSTLKGKKMKLFSSRLIDRDREGLTPGRIAGEASGALHVETGRGIVGIREVQLVGKKRLPVTDFLRGHPVPVGTRFGS